MKSMNIYYQLIIFIWYVYVVYRKLKYRKNILYCIGSATNIKEIQILVV